MSGAGRAAYTDITPRIGLIRVLGGGTGGGPNVDACTVSWQVLLFYPLNKVLIQGSY